MCYRVRAMLSGYSNDMVWELSNGLGTVWICQAISWRLQLYIPLIRTLSSQQGVQKPSVYQFHLHPAFNFRLALILLALFSFSCMPFISIACLWLFVHDILFVQGISIAEQHRFLNEFKIRNFCMILYKKKLNIKISSPL